MDTKTDGMAISLPDNFSAVKAKKILRRIFQDYKDGLAIRLCNTGETITFGSNSPDCILVLNQLQPLRDLILSPNPLHLAEAYFHERVDLEGNIYSALGLREHLNSLSLSLLDKISLWLDALSMTDLTHSKIGNETPWIWSKPLTMQMHSRSMNREAIGFHYDVSNDFYKLWLDEQMIYSCAYFESADESLENAQSNKLDLICRKLNLQPGERLLDIGCGWGALVIWAARHYGVKAHGITLSQNQYDYASQKIREQGLEEKITLELRDYRDIEGEGIYDKISSVGMFEHVGLKNLQLYFGVVHRLLKQGGLFLNHGITQDVEGGTKTLGYEFISKYVFPDGELDMVGNIEREMERASFEINDVESLRPHYALTLREWVRRLEAHHEEALQYVSEAVYRVWRLYMAGCAQQFENGELGVYQILAAKRVRSPLSIPLTRSYMIQKNCH
jgi:cyclopropane-fatty-acyl-phospholipid synthase